MREKTLLIVQEGATAEELQRGANAARALFESAGVKPLDAAHAALKIQGIPENVASPFGQREFEMAALWDKAACVAADACCAGWAEKPKQVGLKLIDLFEERVAAALAPLFPASGEMGDFHDMAAALADQSVAAMTARGVAEPIAMQMILVVVTNLFVDWIGPDGTATLLRHMADKVDAEQLH